MEGDRLVLSAEVLRCRFPHAIVADAKGLDGLSGLLGCLLDTLLEALGKGFSKIYFF
jgi:hypothetical protein